MTELLEKRTAVGTGYGFCNETDRILSEAQRRESLRVEAIVFSNENGILGETSGAEELLEIIRAESVKEKRTGEKKNERNILRSRCRAGEIPSF